MKYLLLVVIKLYWLLIPVTKRNRCLFKKSCSIHVFEITKNQGLIKGLQALKFRFKSCRPGYTNIDIEGKTHILTSNNKLFNISEMREDLIF